MSLVSMTGFAEVLRAEMGVHWRWEVKSVNGRGLDVRVRMPAGWDRLDARVRALASGLFKRGNLQVNLNLEREAGTSDVRVDEGVLARFAEIARRLADEGGLAPARVDGLLALKGVIVTGEEGRPEENTDLDEPLVQSALAAFEALAHARALEGAKLSALLSAQVDEIDRLTGEAGKLAATQPAAIKDRLSGQVRDLVGEGGVSPERLAQEVAMLAVRADVREELDRLGAHVGEARRLLAEGTAVGRKLDFLAQEFNREANTLCSKSSDVALTRIGLDLKATIDQFREQAANVE